MAGQLFQNMRENKNLQVLNLWGNKITNAAMPACEHMMLMNKTLMYFSIGNNVVTDEGAVTLLRAFQAPTLENKEEQKTLKKYNIGSTATKQKVFRDPNMSLKTLNIGHNKITDITCEEAVFTVNYALRPEEVVEEVVETKKGKGKDKGKVQPREFGKENKLEQLIVSQATVSEGIHAMLDVEEKIMCDPLPSTEEDPEGAAAEGDEEGEGDEEAEQEEEEAS